MGVLFTRANYAYTYTAGGDKSILRSRVNPGFGEPNDCVDDDHASGYNLLPSFDYSARMYGCRALSTAGESGFTHLLHQQLGRTSERRQGSS